MHGIKVKIIAFTEASFPGWVRSTFTDIRGKQWFFEEKALIVSDADLDENTLYPVDGIIGGRLEKVIIDSNNQEIATINTAIPWGIESEDGTALFDVYRDQICEFEDEREKMALRQTQDRENNIKKILSNAKAILTNHVGLALGVRKMERINSYIYPRLTEIDLRVFSDFDREVRYCPIGSERLLWDAEALKKQDEIINKAIALYGNEITDKCFELIRLLDK